MDNLVVYFFLLAVVVPVVLIIAVPKLGDNRIFERVVITALFGFFSFAVIYAALDKKKELDENLQKYTSVVAYKMTFIPFSDFLLDQNGSLKKDPIKDTWIGEVQRLLYFYTSGEYKKIIVKDFEEGYIMVPNDAQNIKISKPEWKHNGEYFENTFNGQQVEVGRCSKLKPQANY